MFHFDMLSDYGLVENPLRIHILQFPPDELESHLEHAVRVKITTMFVGSFAWLKFYGSI